MVVGGLPGRTRRDEPRAGWHGFRERAAAQAPERPAVDAPPDDTVPLRMGGEPGDYGELVPATEVRFSSPRSIPDALTLPVALRRLRRIRAPGPEIAVDIDATVEATAEAGGGSIPSSARCSGYSISRLSSTAPRPWISGRRHSTSSSGCFCRPARSARYPAGRLVAAGDNVLIEDAAGDPPCCPPAGRSVRAAVVLVATDGPTSWESPGRGKTSPPGARPCRPPSSRAATALLAGNRDRGAVHHRPRPPAAPNSQYTRRLAGGPTIRGPGRTRHDAYRAGTGYLGPAAVGGTAWASGITATPPDRGDDALTADDSEADLGVPRPRQ